MRIITHSSLIASQIFKPFDPIIFVLYWQEFDLDGTGSLDRDERARGIVRIDKELRSGRLNFLVVLALAGRARVPRGHRPGPFSSDPPMSFMTDTVTVVLSPASALYVPSYATVRG